MFQHFGAAIRSGYAASTWRFQLLGFGVCAPGGQQKNSVQPLARQIRSKIPQNQTIIHLLGAKNNNSYIVILSGSNLQTVGGSNLGGSPMPTLLRIIPWEPEGPLDLQLYGDEAEQAWTVAKILLARWQWNDKLTLSIIQ